MKIKQQRTKDQLVTIQLDKYSAVIMLEAYARKMEDTADQVSMDFRAAFLKDAEEARNRARCIEQGDFLC